MISSQAHAPLSTNRPPNRPFRTVPIPSNCLPPSPAKCDNTKSSKFGSCAIMSRTCTRVTAPVSMVNEVTDLGSFQSEGSHNGENPPYPSGTPPYPGKYILSTSVNHGMHSKNTSGIRVNCPISRHKSLTWWAGLFSCIGNISSHLHALVGVKEAMWKRWRWHG